MSSLINRKGVPVDPITFTQSDYQVVIDALVEQASPDIFGDYPPHSGAALKVLSAVSGPADITSTEKSTYRWYLKIAAIALKDRGRTLKDIQKLVRRSGRKSRRSRHSGSVLLAWKQEMHEITDAIAENVRVLEKIQTLLTQTGKERP